MGRELIVNFIIGIVAITLLLIVTVFFIGVGLNLAHGAVDSNGNIVPDKPPKLNCLYFNDGKTAIVRFFPCDGYYETISWFLKHGYKIAAISVRTGNGEYPMVYMTR